MADESVASNDILPSKTNIPASDEHSHLSFDTLKNDVERMTKKPPSRHITEDARFDNAIHDIDYVGTGTFQVSQLNLLNIRSIEPIKSSAALLSSRGLHHRSRDVFVREVQNASGIISSLRRREKMTGLKYVPSPQLFHPHFQRALANERLNNIDKAIEDYNTCLRIDSKYAPIYFNRGGLYKVKKDLKRALEDLETAVKLDPSNVEYRKSRALLYRETGMYSDAVKETILTRALIRQPNIAKALEAGNEVELEGDMAYSVRIAEDPILKSLAVPGKQRTDTEKGPIRDFLRSVRYFSTFAGNYEMINEIAGRVELETYEKGDQIFAEGQPGNCFYIILDGEVAIVKVKKVYDDMVETTVLVRMFRGHTFGETALESKGGLRTAGAVAAQFCRLLVLQAEQYQSILITNRTALKEEVRAILGSSILFQDWDAEKIDYLASFAIVKNFDANAEIMKCNEPPTSLMMIKSGVVHLVKNISSKHIGPLKKTVSECNIFNEAAEEVPGLWILQKQRLSVNSTDMYGGDSYFTPDHSRKNSSAAGNASNSLFPQVGKLSRNASNNSINSRRASHMSTTRSLSSNEDGDEVTMDFTVGILGSGQVFGELCVLDPNQPSPVAAISSTAVEIYCFESDVLLATGARFNTNTMKALSESLTLHDPPPEKIAYYFRSKYNWELRKNKLMHNLKYHSN